MTPALRDRLAAPLVVLYWLALASGLALYTAIRAADTDAAVSLWIGVIAGTALGHVLALRDYRLAAAALAVVGALVFVIIPFTLPFDLALIAKVFVPAALCAFASLADRWALAAFWFPAVIWMLSILDHAGARAVPDGAGTVLLGVLALLFLGYLRARESRRVGLWRAVAVVPLARVAPVSLLKESPGLRVARLAWGVTAAALAIAVTAWVAPPLWRVEVSAGEPAPVAHGGAGLPCCPALDAEAPRARLKEYLDLGRGSSLSPPEPGIECRVCRGEPGAGAGAGYLDGGDASADGAIAGEHRGPRERSEAWWPRTPYTPNLARPHLSPGDAATPPGTIVPYAPFGVAPSEPVDRFGAPSQAPTVRAPDATAPPPAAPASPDLVDPDRLVDPPVASAPRVPSPLTAPPAPAPSTPSDAVAPPAPAPSTPSDAVAPPAPAPSTPSDAVAPPAPAPSTPPDTVASPPVPTPVAPQVEPVPFPDVVVVPRASAPPAEPVAAPATIAPASARGVAVLDALATVLVAALAFVLAFAALRPLRRLVTLRHLRRSLWDETVDQRVSNWWQLALVGLRDAGWRPGANESPRELARRVGVDGVERCAAILERARHGIALDNQDLAEMSASADTAYHSARARLGPLARAATWLRSPLT